ncbi:MAG: hypothetical protein AAF907_12275, partial [Planctomycetota bacterium]
RIDPVDKLQPLITHRFWIGTGLTVVLAIVAWWMGTSTLSEQIQTNEAKVEGINVPEGQGSPNPEYVSKGKIENARLESELVKAASRLADTQENLRDWPEEYRTYVEGIE